RIPRDLKQAKLLTADGERATLPNIEGGRETPGQGRVRKRCQPPLGEKEGACWCQPAQNHTGFIRSRR
ncbi:MAG: hypothetical protein ACO3T7_08185, partial [Pseudomonadales bacterium]